MPARKLPLTPEQMQARRRAQRRVRTGRYRQRHPERVAAAERAWVERNRERKREINRRARRRVRYPGWLLGVRA